MPKAATRKPLKDAPIPKQTIEPPNGESSKPVLATIPQRTAVMVPLAQLVRGPNIRKPESYSSKGLQEMVESIAAKGILQSLKARPQGQHYEIITGGRRLTALEILRKQGRIGEDYPVPLLVEETNDRAAVEDGINENIHREDMHPLDEARAFRAALEADPALTVAELAARSGKSEASVLKRLQLAARLSPAGEKAYRAGKIGFNEAVALSALEEEIQQKLIKKGELRLHFMREMASSSGFPVKRAIFTKEQAQGLEVREDLFGQIEPYYVDGKSARNLQASAALQLAERLRNKWAWAEVIQTSFYQEEFRKRGWDPYNHTKDKSQGGAVVVIYSSTFEVMVIEGVLPLPGRKSTGPSSSAPASEKRPVHWLTQSTALAAKNTKIGILQEAVLRSPERKLLELMAAGLLGARGLNFAVRSPQYVAQAARDAVKRSLGETRYAKEGDAHSFREKTALSVVLADLARLSDQGLWTLLRGLLAQGFSQADHRNIRQNEATDMPAAVALAEHLRDTVDPLAARGVISVEWLKGFQLERLEAMHRELGLGKLPGTKRGIAEQIVAALPTQPDWLPAELHIGYHVVKEDEAELEDEDDLGDDLYADASTNEEE